MGATTLLTALTAAVAATVDPLFGRTLTMNSYPMSPFTVRYAALALLCTDVYPPPEPARRRLKSYVHDVSASVFDHAPGLAVNGWPAY